MKPLQVPCDLAKVETMSRGKLKLIFVTQELIPEEVKAKFLTAHEKFGWLNFLAGENEIDAVDLLDLPKIKKSEEEQKSPSQKLRNVLHVLWEQKGRPTDTSEEYYRKHMEVITNQYKEMLT
jgi:hypothetical protein